MKTEKILKAARRIKKYCGIYGFCNDCLFNDGSWCALMRKRPDDWVLPENEENGKKRR